MGFLGLLPITILGSKKIPIRDILADIQCIIFWMWLLNSLETVLVLALIMRHIRRYWYICNRPISANNIGKPIYRSGSRDNNIHNCPSIYRDNIHVWKKFQIDASSSGLDSECEGRLWELFTFILGCTLTDGQTQSVTVCFLPSLWVSGRTDPSISWVLGVPVCV